MSGIVYRVIATHLIKKAGQMHTTARTGAVVLIQRSGSALNLNIHFHMLLLDGVYVDNPHGSARFRWVKAPTGAELTRLAHTVARRVGCFLERQGLPERDARASSATDRLYGGDIRCMTACFNSSEYLDIAYHFPPPAFSWDYRKQ